jgi:hypothetical protein
MRFVTGVAENAGRSDTPTRHIVMKMTTPYRQNVNASITPFLFPMRGIQGLASLEVALRGARNGNCLLNLN